MEEIVKKYIIIKQSDFFGPSFYRSEESYFRSLEKYLEKNNESYKTGWKDCTVYVRDIGHAIKIGRQFGLSRLDYFDGVKLSPFIIENDGRRYKRPKIFDETGKSISFKKFKNQSFNKINTSCMQDLEIIKGGLLKKREIAKAFDEGKLSRIEINKKVFIDKLELAKFLKNNK